MKTNPIVRIVLFSLVILILLGALLTGLAVQAGVFSFDAIAGESSDGQDGLTTLHHTESNHNSTSSGTSATPTEGTSTADTTPASEATSSDTVTTTGYTVYADPSTVKELEIEWLSGEITIIPSQDVTQIVVEDDPGAESQYQMVCKTVGNKLEIEFCQNAHSQKLTAPEKSLTIYVPTDWVCNELDIEAAASTVTVSDLTIVKVDYEGSSGTCTFTNCSFTTLDVDVAYGDVTYTGTLDTLECDAASATCYVVLSNTPRSIELDTASGTLDLTLPENCGFTADLESTGIQFTSDFQTTLTGSRHVCGNGSCKISVEGLTGSVIIRKGAAG